MCEMVCDLTREQKMQNLLVGKIRYSACSGLFKRMKDIPYAVIKGEPLSLYCYGETGCRNSCDIDILISPRDVDVVERILKEEGFEQKKVGETERERRMNTIFCLTHTHQTLPFEKKVGMYNVEIDLNFDLLWGNKNENQIDVTEFLKETDEIAIYGQRIKILSPEKAFVQMCLHHYKEMNSIFLILSKKRINVNMFKEVYYFLFNNESLTPQAVLDISDRFKIGQYIFYMIYYANKVMRNDFLTEYVDMLYSVEGMSLIDKYGLTDQTRKAWNCSFEDLFECDDLSLLIADDLTEEDKKQIEMDSSVFEKMV